MTTDQNAIWDYLVQNAPGKLSAVTMAQIQADLDIPSGGLTNENIRELIRDMVLNHGKPIGTYSKGVWVIQSEDELNDAINGLQSRAEENTRRAGALRNNWDNL